MDEGAGAFVREYRPCRKRNPGGYVLGTIVGGGWVWGDRARKLDNPLLTYGLLELAVAISVVGYFFILDAYHQLYPVIFALFETTRSVFVAVSNSAKIG